MSDLLNIVREAARAGGMAAERARSEGGLKEVKLGRGGDIALEGDLAAERAVVEVIESRLNCFTIVSEELGELSRGGGVTFVVDPLDGSRNYKLGIPIFATSVAAAEGSSLDDVVAAAIYAPALNIEMYAERGRGAYLNGRRIRAQPTSERPVVSVNSTPKASALPCAVMLVLASRGAVVRNLGAASLELSLVAAGAMDAYVDPWFATRVVDVAAAVLLAREAGAVLQMRGRFSEVPQLSIDERVSLVAAADEGILRFALEALRALGVEASLSGLLQFKEKD